MKSKRAFSNKVADEDDLPNKIISIFAVKMLKNNKKKKILEVLRQRSILVSGCKDGACLCYPSSTITTTTTTTIPTTTTTLLQYCTIQVTVYDDSTSNPLQGATINSRNFSLT